MKIQIKVGREWRDANATINSRGVAVIALKPPLIGKLEFPRRQWRKVQAKRAK